MKPNKIAVIGGTGKAGKYLVRELIKQGYSIKLLVRDPQKFREHAPFVEIVTGNANSYEDIHALLEGCDAVISTLGLGQPNSEKNIFSTSTGNILKAMADFGIKRYIVITGLNVDTQGDRKSPKVQMGTDWMKANFPETTADKQKEFDMLSASEANWTLVRLPVIVQTDERSKVDVSLEDCEGDKINAADLAVFLIEQINSGSYSRKTPFLFNS